MLLIICAEEKEAERLDNFGSRAIIQVTGIGYDSVIRIPRFVCSKNDKVLNIGYAGSNVYKPGDVLSVKSCKLFDSSKQLKTRELTPLYFNEACCYTADDFIQFSEDKIELVDMELYYLSLIYPKIQSIKIVSDNLNYQQYKSSDFAQSWDKVNQVVWSLINE